MNKLSHFIDKHLTVDDFGVYDEPNMDNTSTCNSNLSIDIIMCMNNVYSTDKQVTTTENRVYDSVSGNVLILI